MTAMVSLRALMEQRPCKNFVDGGVADIQVPALEIDRRLAAIQRGLVAHDALSQLLKTVGDEPPDTMVDAINAAYDENLINNTERKWLRYYNNEANQAKHNRMPF